MAGRLLGAPDQGGATWAALQYLLGLLDLGHDVLFIESLDPDPGRRALMGRRYRELLRQLPIEGRYLPFDDGRSSGSDSARHRIEAWSRSADVLINLSGVLRDTELTKDIPIRVFVDLDPAFTQLWEAAGGIDMGLTGHTHFATLGLGVGGDGRKIPSLGVDWIGLLPPVALRYWPARPPGPRRGFATVGNWRSYGTIDAGGVRYGQRVHTVRPLAAIPTLIAAPVTLAVDLSPQDSGDLGLLRRNSWRLVSARRVAGSAAQYQSFVASCQAELGLPKAGYVTSRSGWFSDRSAAFLASGRPVVMQDTGISSFLPCGKGLFCFDGVDDAVGIMSEVYSDLPDQALSARRFAEEHLDGCRVLAGLLARVEAT